ncbi:hypothetical protein [Nocardia brasiliensis]|uniref:Uncharacterized protein n=1 Tax=Nocardia brasiliensis (strain ATCC 700358 / HUJEG-1) TaxID=1133849 RepID=K0FA05_NOCB7|nr:hypothetical protein [Nocardia brasiliensis]AFU06230.1 hypothetical protein O3I_041425 [Nocardia brasiliensis ATCC 700358]OCF88590.1 hypothetical protein AW168_19875 [Nocardia brasiliensis]
MQVDYGRAEIQAFNQAAGAGELEFDKEAVREVVRAYDLLIDGLVAEQQNIKSILNLAGFGGFGSAQQLATGFSNKANQLFDVLTQFIEGAIRLQEAYLRAGQMYEEADQKNAAALRFVGESDGLTA